MVRDPFARRFTEVDDGVQMHVRTFAPLFRISGTAGRIALKFWSAVRDPSVRRFREVNGGVQVHVRVGHFATYFISAQRAFCGLWHSVITNIAFKN